ncbi:MAG: Crp/Fnr family transcriptional regulator [Spirosomataceae bacterium]
MVTEILNSFDTIYPIGAEAKQALAAIIKEIDYKKNVTIQRPGNSCRTVYFVVKGVARIFYYKDGNDITEHFAFTNEMMVRAESLFSGKPTPKGIQTLDDSKIIAIDSYKLFMLYDRFHDIERLFRLLFEREHIKTIKRIESLQFKNATERYLELLSETDLVQHIPLKHIASYLGITQVSLSRIRASV